MKADHSIGALSRFRYVCLLVVAVVLCFSLRGEDITLKDGRRFPDAKIISQSPDSVTIRYAGGMSQVEKDLLPDKFLAIYPIDPSIIEAAKAKALAQAKTREAAEKGDALAELNLGDMYHDGDGVTKDSMEAFKWYRKAAEQGNAIAEFDLGLMYDDADGVRKDSEASIKWYQKAAEHGSSAAEYNLGLIYDNGDGVPKDAFEAVRWYRKAAIQGDTSAQVNLGYYYSNGEGVPKDEVEGLAWTYIAAASGDEQSVKNREVMERHLGR